MATFFLQKGMAIQMNGQESDRIWSWVSSTMVIVILYIYVISSICHSWGEQGGDFLWRVSIHNVVILNLSKGKDSVNPGLTLELVWPKVLLSVLICITCCILILLLYLFSI